MNIVVAMLLVCNTSVETSQVIDFLQAGASPTQAVEMTNSNAKEQVCGSVKTTWAIGKREKYGEYNIVQVLAVDFGVVQYAIETPAKKEGQDA